MALNAIPEYCRNCNRGSLGLFEEAQYNGQVNLNTKSRYIRLTSNGLLTLFTNTKSSSGHDTEPKIINATYH